MFTQLVQRVVRGKALSPSRENMANQRAHSPPTQQEMYYKSINRLLEKCESDPSVSGSENIGNGDVCCVCLDQRATVRCYPCAHKVFCRKCGVIIIKTLVDQNKSEMRCVVCRTQIIRLRYCRPTPEIHIRVQPTPPYELGFHPTETSRSVPHTRSSSATPDTRSHSSRSGSSGSCSSNFRSRGSASDGGSFST